MSSLACGEICTEGNTVFLQICQTCSKRNYVHVFDSFISVDVQRVQYLGPNFRVRSELNDVAVFEPLPAFLLAISFICDAPNIQRTAGTG